MLNALLNQIFPYYRKKECHEFHPAYEKYLNAVVHKTQMKVSQRIKQSLNKYKK